MKKTILEIPRVLFVLLFTLLFVQPASAHGDEPRLEISTDRMNPGGVVEVRGVDFEFEELIALALVGEEYEMPLGGITADAEGIFLQIATLPTDLKEGAYQFRAVTDNHEILSPALTVQGPAIVSEEGGGQGQRDGDDPLLAPMPTYAPGIAPRGVTQPAEQTEPQAAPVSNRNSMAFIASFLLMVVVLIVLGSRVRKTR